ncbi:MAG: hypothetical protein Q8J78_04895 [Moraxellaceae bacterium]|nr:hypothetical protein [Moraxellaceae bacterium]
MKTPRAILLIATVAASLLAAGCSTKSYSEKLTALEQLGVTELEITGKFSHTEFRRTETADGKTVSTLDHSNAWVPKVRVVRERATPTK